jgi:CHAD domain-containing protein
MPLGDSSEINSDPNSTATVSTERIGLVAWMDRVVTELDRTQLEFEPDAVHDLRVALRRCHSIADVFIALDPLPDWAEMRKAGRKLFRCLGELRDVQVMKEWIGRISGDQDAAGIHLRAYLDSREAVLFELAAEARTVFSRKKWLKWQERLAQPSLVLPLGDPVFQQFALEHWRAAYDLHHQALRNRSKVSFHRLRIGLKRLRYVVENFLPEQHEIWGKDLKQLQDALGELHDLAVLWQTALRTGSLADRGLRSRWRERIEEESRDRVLTYRSKMVGRESLWPVWRAGLPRDSDLRSAAEDRIRLWASYRDREFSRTMNVADLALQLYDGLERESRIAPGSEEPRSTLRVAALLSNVGKHSRKARYKLIRKTDPPLGFPAHVYQLVALTIRSPRDVGIRLEEKPFARLSEYERRSVQLFAAILHLAESLAGKNDHGMRHIEVAWMNDVLVISAEGYREEDAMARRLAAARHPLEVAIHAPILIRPISGEPKKDPQTGVDCKDAESSDSTKSFDT